MLTRDYAAICRTVAGVLESQPGVGLTSSYPHPITQSKLKAEGGDDNALELELVFANGVSASVTIYVEGEES